MTMTDPGPIESTRLLLRLVLPSDLPALLVVNGQDEVTKFLPYATWRTMDDAEAWYERTSALQAGGEALQFVIVDKSSGDLIGTSLLFRFEKGSARAEIGYVLGRAYWKRGYMREALRALIGCAFGAMALRRLEAQVDTRNTSSDRLLLDLGFIREGLLRKRWVAKGEEKDVTIYGLLRHEWAS